MYLILFLGSTRGLTSASDIEVTLHVHGILLIRCEVFSVSNEWIVSVNLYQSHILQIINTHYSLRMESRVRRYVSNDLV